MRWLKQKIPGWKVVALVLLVVLPGGSLVLLAWAGWRAWKQRAPGTSLRLPRLPPIWLRSHAAHKA